MGPECVKAPGKFPKKAAPKPRNAHGYPAVPMPRSSAYFTAAEFCGILSLSTGGAPPPAPEVTALNDTAKQYASLFRQVKTATAQGRPQARIINIMRAEDDGMYIVTSKGKPFYKQLVDTGEIALAAMCPGCQPLKFTGRLHP